MSPRFCVFTILVACGGGAGGDDQLDPDGGMHDGSTSHDAAHVPTRTATIDVQLIAPGFSETPETKITGGFIAQPVCARSTAGACAITRCEIGQKDSFAAPGKLHVTFAGGEFGWDPGMYPLVFSADAIPWASNEVVKVHGDGATVPAFTVQSTSPTTLDAGFDGPRFNVPLPRTQPLHVAWNPSAGGALVVLEQDTDSQSTSHVTIECTGSGPSGGLDIPPDALAKLSYTDGGILDEVRARTWHVNTASVDAGDYAIRLRVLRAFTDQLTYYKPS